MACESRWLGRLNKMMIETRLCRPSSILLLAPAGQGGQHRAFHTRLLSQSSRDLVAVHARHADVEEHHMRQKGRRQGKRRSAVVGDLHLVSMQSQQHGEAHGGVPVLRRVRQQVAHDLSEPDRVGIQQANRAAATAPVCALAPQSVAGLSCDLLAAVAQHLQLSPIDPQDLAFRTDPMQADGGVLEELRQFPFAASELVLGDFALDELSDVPAAVPIISSRSGSASHLR